MPTVTLPSASSFTHSWDLVYLRVLGMLILILLDQRFAVTGEIGFDDTGLEPLAADFHCNFIADIDAWRYAGERDGTLQSR